MCVCILYVYVTDRKFENFIIYLHMLGMLTLQSPCKSKIGAQVFFTGCNLFVYDWNAHNLPFPGVKNVVRYVFKQCVTSYSQLARSGQGGFRHHLNVHT